MSLLLATAWLLGGCPPSESSPPIGARPADLRDENPRKDTRFVQIRDLLLVDPESTERATKLYPLLHPVCEDEAERKQFIEVASWSASKAEGPANQLARIYAEETIEFVATSCSRTSSTAAFDLFERATEALGSSARLELAAARLWASFGDLSRALVAAEHARARGSVHAIALAGNIQAQIARSKTVGYAEGMLDPAIATVSVEPEASWQAIDLTAVLSTRARLLLERAIWESGDAAIQSRREARSTLDRLSVAPFVAVIRSRAQDVGCFERWLEGTKALEPCRTAAVEFGSLGGAYGAQVPMDAEGFDVERFQRLLAFRKRLFDLPEGALVVLIARGDEAELLEWAQAAASLLASLEEKKPSLVVVDRTSTPRSRALLERILHLGHARADTWVDAQKDVFAVPCLAAVAARRRAPDSCPLTPAVRTRLDRAQGLHAVILLGRDLDAEIDDLELYEHPTLLLSFRETQVKKRPDAWLKGVADAQIMIPPKAPQ